MKTLKGESTETAELLTSLLTNAVEMLGKK